ncbi:MAG TPA: LacI family DNA-binding transcriptional regulator [Microlunatus sp.]
MAERAGVSRALVSIVMREAPGASATTRSRVLAAAQELGYRPDARARSLAGRASNLIGVMFGVGVGAFHFDLLEGLYAAAEEQGYNLILSPVTRGRDEAKAAESLQDFRFDGLIMLGPATPVPLLAGRLPVAVVGWHVDHPKVDVVRTSDEIGMAVAVDHLVGLGHRRITHLDGGETMIGSSRRAAFEAAMRRHGLAESMRVVPGGQAQVDGQRAARQLIGDNELPTALVAYNDDTATAVMGVLAQQGIAVPTDVSMIGWDDSEAAALSLVGLTSVVQQPAELARLAVERIVDRINRRRVAEREIVLLPGLRVRDSTGPPPGRMS